MVRKPSLSNKKWKKRELFCVCARIKIHHITKSKNENRLNKIIQMGFNVANTQTLVRIDSNENIVDDEHVCLVSGALKRQQVIL